MNTFVDYNHDENQDYWPDAHPLFIAGRCIIASDDTGDTLFEYAAGEWLRCGVDAGRIGVES